MFTVQPTVYFEGMDPSVESASVYGDDTAAADAPLNPATVSVGIVALGIVAVAGSATAIYYEVRRAAYGAMGVVAASDVGWGCSVSSAAAGQRWCVAAEQETMACTPDHCRPHHSSSSRRAAPVVASRALLCPAACCLLLAAAFPHTHTHKCNYEVCACTSRHVTSRHTLP